MVERFNRTLLQLLWGYTEHNDLDWERNLTLMLYAYRAASNASTGFSPFVLMMGRDPVLPSITNSSAEDPTSYDSNLRVKMAELRDMVESHIVQEAKHQKEDYGTHIPKIGSFVKLMLFGYKTQQRENWIQTGKVDGLLRKFTPQ